LALALHAAVEWKERESSMSKFTAVLIMTSLLATACKNSDNLDNSNAKSIYSKAYFWDQNKLAAMDYCIDPNFDSKYVNAIKEAIKEAAAAWGKYVDLSLKFKDTCTNGDLKIKSYSKPNGARANAILGGTSINLNTGYNKNEFTPLFNGDGTGTKILKPIILHELGHILGLVHAHAVDYDENGNLIWTDEIEAKPAGELNGVKDEYSAMFYPHDKESRFGSWDKHPGISFWDVVAINKMYPKKVFGFETMDSISYTDWFSKNESESCPEKAVAYGLRCKDDYCKNLRLLCRAVPKDYLVGEAVVEISEGVITEVTCNNNNNCNKPEVPKRQVNTASYFSRPNRNCYETDQFTDMSNAPVKDYGICRQDESMTSINCKDAKCDNVTITCCPLYR
jgi:hypothetical protein